ncbi:hypothetical protein KIW84_010111 [Lathyrus oleraceus]|uniref:Retrotransposon gag domain-containing protein n=1 Tax=Pisum sativum TaxID=3888 RepID=A0A9D4YNE7_PEA|nr:hypothetical protein KIW84_010111 [Pisum sativum]
MDSASIHTFNDLGEAFVKQYKYNMDMAPDRAQLRSMSQKDMEKFKEYAQIWRELTAKISPPLEEMTKIFLKMLSSFYYEHMIASSPNDFTEMVNMEMRLEEGVREGRLTKEEASASKKYSGSFSKRKEGETNSVTVGRQMRFHLRNPPQIPEPLPWLFKPDLHCAFRQGAPGHDIENCYPLKYEVQKLMNNGMVSFEDRAPNMKASLLPIHGNTSINMVDGCPGMNPHGCVVVKRDIQKLMDENVIQIQQSGDIGDDVNVIVPMFKTPERVVIQFDSINNNNVNTSVSPLVIRLVIPIPYASDKAMPYQYNATMIENDQEVPLPVADSMVNIADIAKVTRSGLVFSSVFPKVVDDVSLSKKA